MHSHTEQCPSWLELERFHLGELPPERAAEIRALLDTDPEVQARMADIQRGAELKSLPQSLETGKARQPWLTWWLGVPAMAALGVILWVQSAQLPPTASTGRGVGDVVRVKGSGAEIEAVGLIAQRDGQQVPISDRFRPDDALKLTVTCTPPESRLVHSALVQDGEMSALLPPAEVQCGNAVPLQGAFRLEAAPALICVRPTPFEAGAPLDPDALPEGAKCLRLEPM